MYAMLEDTEKVIYAPIVFFYVNEKAHPFTNAKNNVSSRNQALR